MLQTSRITAFWLGSLFLLTACMGSKTASFSLTFDALVPADLHQELAQQSLRVIERRMERIGEELTDKSFTTSDTGINITISMTDGEAIEILTQELAEPFKMRVMSETTPEDAQITVEGHGGFKETGITEEDIYWVQSRVDDATGKGEVRLLFTDQGRAKMADLFAVMKGKSIGIFVRDRLVSKLSVQTDTLEEDILIRDIPDAELAQIFAEDINVGAHVIFTPIP